MKCYVYILTNKNHNVLYTGVTSNLVKRVYEHKNHFDKDSFTNRYNVAKLVYFGKTTDIKAAIEREKQIKGWSKSKKNGLIFKMNLKWIDLYNRIIQ